MCWRWAPLCHIQLAKEEIKLSADTGREQAMLAASGGILALVVFLATLLVVSPYDPNVFFCAAYIRLLCAGCRQHTCKPIAEQEYQQGYHR